MHRPEARAREHRDDGFGDQRCLVGVAGQHVVVEGVEAGVRPEALGIVQAPAVDRLEALPFSHDH
ncbi:MAG: hypothetical protein ACH36H_09755 [Candidatus Nanopelagicales bacterium]